MKKYKHKQSNDQVIELVINKGYYQSIFTNTTLPAKYIENTNDWEEVVEKNYKILELKNTSNDIIFHRCEDDKFSSTYPLDKKRGFENEGYFLKMSHFTIHSVTRLSDGEVFTVGDEIDKWGGIIKEFKTDARVIVDCKGPGVVADVSFKLENIEKGKKPLFTTEDGVDIFEGDNFWLLQDTKTFHLKYWNWDIMSFPNTEYLSNKLKFSTKEAAEEYIDRNKPIFSKNDAEEIFYLWSSGDCSIKESIEKYTKKL
jgi:hypothetical protein